MEPGASAWSPLERRAVARAIEGLDDRWAIDAWLGRRYGLIGVEREEGVEYSGPGVAGWIRVRYRGARVRAVVILDAVIPDPVILHAVPQEAS